MNILVNDDRSAFIVLFLFVLFSGQSKLYENINPDLQDSVQQQVCALSLRSGFMFELKDTVSSNFCKVCYFEGNALHKIHIFHIVVLSFGSQLLLKTFQVLKKTPVLQNKLISFWCLETEPFLKRPECSGTNQQALLAPLPSNPNEAYPVT